MNKIIFLALFPAFAFAQDAATYRDKVQPFINDYCVSCHGPDRQKGDLRLDTLAPDFTKSLTASLWIEVRDNLNLGEMPPEDETQPSGEEVIAVSNWIAGELKAMQAIANSSGGRSLLRRLSRTEYTNTVEDLFDIEFEIGEGPQEILPPDGSIAGFNKVSKALLLDPSLMENYFDAARFVADRAIRVRPPRVRTHTGRYEFESIPDTMGIGYIAAQRAVEIVDNGAFLYRDQLRTGSHPRHPYNDQSIPILGKYKIRVRAGAKKAVDSDKPIFMETKWRTQSKRFRVDAPIDEPAIYEWTETFDSRVQHEFQVLFVDGPQFSSTDIDSGSHRGELERFGREGNTRDSLRVWQQGAAEGNYTVFQQDTPTDASRDLTKLAKLFVDYLEIEGPLQEPYPPASMTVIFPDGVENSEARDIFARLMPRAFRRPVTDEEIAAQLEIVSAELDLGKPFHEAIKTGIIAMLCSPDFLLLLEPAEDERRQLTDFELATRLSYFLWSSTPDATLIDSAAAGDLRGSLDDQINRMLADPRAEALVEDFAAQWLRIDEFDQFAPDEGIYGETYYKPEFAQIGVDLEEEARAFFREILHKNESVLNFLDSDWTMANEKLAAFYDFDPVSGEEFRRVSIPADSPRGGIVGMAGFHKWGADGNRTKPVERGKYILGVLFNDPPDPPPPNAGEVEPNIQGERLTVRERLLRHQEVEACAGCHRTIDPYGLALENFNAVGLWREFQDGEDRYFWRNNQKPIVAEGTLPNGNGYNDYESFKTLLVDQGDRLRRGLAEKFFVYALGRTIEPTDDATLSAIVEKMKTGDDSIADIIRAIANSEAFLTK